MSVNASTTRTTHTPGGTMYHQHPVVIAPTSKALSSMVPHDVRVGFALTAGGVVRLQESPPPR